MIELGLSGFAAIVLAGGQAARLGGADKASIEVGGRSLLERALALADVPALGLIVSEGNPARGLYEVLGFRYVDTRVVVQL